MIRRRSGRGSARGSQVRRWIDHICGAPLLFAVGLVRRKRRFPATVRSVGILSCSAIGDTVIVSAIARDLKSSYPHCKVTVFIAPGCRGISTLVDGFDQEVILPITDIRGALRILRAHPSDVLIDITPWPRVTALLGALLRNTFTIGFRTDRQHRHFAFDATVRHSGYLHELENLRALLTPFGIAGALYPNTRERFRTMSYGPVKGTKEVVFHPWASGFRSNMREWPLSRWAEVARHLIADGVTVVITGGPSDRARAEALARMIDRPGKVAITAGSATLADTTARLATAAAVVSVNTGTMHLAAALDQKLIALHGPTNPVRWGPLSDQAVIIGPDRSRGGAYLNLGFEYPPDAPDCMQLITTEEVLASLRRLMDSADTRVNRYVPALSTSQSGGANDQEGRTTTPSADVMPYRLTSGAGLVGQANT